LWLGCRCRGNIRLGFLLGQLSLLWLGLLLVVIDNDDMAFFEMLDESM
jgi:hypothetical protein